MDGDRDLVDKPRSGRPKSVNRDDLKEAVDANPFLTTRELGIQFNCSSSIIFDGLKDIDKVNKRGRWLPHDLSDTNKFQRVTTCSTLLYMSKRSGLWHSIVTGDKN